MNPEFKRLCNDDGWKAEHFSTEWACYKKFSVGTGNIDEIARRQITNLLYVKKEIRKLVTFAKNRL